AEIVPKLLERLQSHAEAKQARRDAVALPAGSSLEHRVDAAEARRVRDQAEGGLDGTRLVGALDVEGQQPPEAGIADALDLRVGLQPLRQHLRGFGLAASANLQRLQSAEEQPARVRCGDDSGPRAE